MKTIVSRGASKRNREKPLKLGIESKALLAVGGLFPVFETEKNP